MSTLLPNLLSTVIDCRRDLSGRIYRDSCHFKVTQILNTSLKFVAGPLVCVRLGGGEGPPNMQEVKLSLLWWEGHGHGLLGSIDQMLPPKI